jgi:hypothetical protein
VRLSLVLPISFVEGGSRSGRSWAMTRSHFWPLLGACALAFVFTSWVAPSPHRSARTRAMVFGGVSVFAQMQGGGELSTHPDDHVGGCST